VILTLALPVFLYGTFYVARGILRGLRSATWEETSGTVLVSKVERFYRGRDVAKEMHRLSYGYAVNETLYEGTRASHKTFEFLFGNLSNMAAKYPANQDVTVYYDPLQPDVSILEKGTSRADMIFLCVLALVDAGILLIWIPPVPVLSILGVALLVFLVLVFRQLNQNNA